MSTARMLEHSGGCLCGDVRYVVAGQLRPVIYCHCGQCKKTSGNFVAATACDGAQLSIKSAESLAWFTSSKSAKRGFCKRCGSNLFWKPIDRDHVSIFAGTLDSDTGLEAQEHIYVESKAGFLTLGDDLPQHATVAHK